MDWTRVALGAVAGAAGLSAMVATTLGEDGYANKTMVYPDQGWSAEDRLRYYNTSQGSAALWYDIFLNLPSTIPMAFRSG